MVAATMGGRAAARELALGGGEDVVCRSEVALRGPTQLEAAPAQ
jgi:hypothetical protein